MNSVKKTMLTFIACVAVILVHSQTIDELQAKYVKALGGKEKLATLKNVVQEANMEVMGMQMPAKVWIVYGEGSRQEVEIQGQKMVTYIGKEKGWMINPLAGSTDAQPLPDEAVKGAAGALNAGGELYNYKENGYTASFEGKDTVNAMPAYKIKLTKGEYVNTIYLDASTYYIVKSVAKANVMGQDIEQTTNFGDYKKTPQGFFFPYSSTISNPMVGEIKATLTKLEVNAAVDIKELEKSN